MKREIRKIKDKSKRTYVYRLSAQGRITRYVNEKTGAVMYDTAEYQMWRNLYKKHGHNQRSEK